MTHTNPTLTELARKPKLLDLFSGAGGGGIPTDGSGRTRAGRSD